MDYSKYDSDREERGFFERYGVTIGIVVLGIAVVLIVAGRNLFSHSSASHKAPELVMLSMPKLPPPPPPPPQPKPPEQKMENKMIEQTPVDDKEEKPDDKPPEAAPDLSTNLTGGNGPDMGLSRGGGNTGVIGGGRHSSGSRWGWYAAKVQSQIGDALRRNARTKAASMSVTVRIWPDPATGRVTRATLAGTSGDPGIDQALRNEILSGLQLSEPPPAGMPAPIVMRITARRPQ